jgi:hypothetical protein
MRVVFESSNWKMRILIIDRSMGFFHNECDLRDLSVLRRILCLQTTADAVFVRDLLYCHVNTYIHTTQRGLLSGLGSSVIFVKKGGNKSTYG